MDPRNIYLEELIKKDLLEQLTAEEEILLEKEKKRYTEEEYDFIVIAVLQKLEGQLPAGPLDEWQPDYKEIVKRGKAIRRKRRLNEWGGGLQVAATFLLVGSIIYYLFISKQDTVEVLRFEGECLHLSENVIVPVEESTCMLLVEDSTWLKVESSAVGNIRQVGDLLISRTKEGVLKIERRAVYGHDKPRIKNLIVYTGPKQQCVMELEDGTRLRLNAQSYITYPLQAQDTTYIGFMGEAYVETAMADKNRALVLGTVKGKVIPTKAEFVIRSTKDFTKTVLNRGELDLYSYRLKKAQSLYCAGDLGVLVATRGAKDKALKDTLIRTEGMDFEVASMWMHTMRTYKEISLGAFVDEMSRWEGFTIRNWNCVPKDKFVTVSICYRSNREEVYSAIRQAGVLLHEEKGMISFCPEDTEHKVAMKLEE